MTATSPSRASPVSSLVSPRVPGADLEHLGGRDAFGIRQVGVRDERAAERDREQHAEDRRRSGR